MKNSSDYTVVGLKELLKNYGLPIARNKVELIARLDVNYPDGSWLGGKTNADDESYRKSALCCNCKEARAYG